ncbi:hypothetical protein [Burkholderia territorii]|nr:hypothetical protein [Burkholderia territorii]
MALDRGQPVILEPLCEMLDFSLLGATIPDLGYITIDFAHDL